MKFTIITLFPEFLEGPLSTGLMGKAAKAGLIEFKLVNLREFGEGRHRTVDDEPYGGGAGMVLKAGPVVEAIEQVREQDPGVRVVMLTPQGVPFRQPTARNWSAQGGSIAFVCGRYEGFDERIRDFVDEEASLGDFVLMGGEAAALAMVEATARLIDGVLGDLDSTVEESLSGGLLEYPHYTRPREFRGREVPEVLLGGNHAEIARWRRARSVERTAAKRPELLEGAELTEQERQNMSMGDGDDK